MIAIKRPEKPDFMSVAGNKWDLETAMAIEYYLNGAEAEFKYVHYNDPQLKNELKKIFVKCAYCESQYDHVFDGDVEHFRPKGRVNEKDPQSPGYYWLANDWENLLLSCQHCNQRRRHELYGDEFITPAGKLDQFPLKEGYVHLTNPAQSLALEEEGRLLLNPCLSDDDPESHFEYEEEKAIIKGLSEKGRKSIEVYALRRPFLVSDRNVKKDFLFKQMGVTKRELTRLNNDHSVEQLAIFKFELENLFFFAKPEQPYAGMARYFIKKFLAENNLQNEI